jgi:tRNA (Thr-GGU) A37 N-methylase
VPRGNPGGGAPEATLEIYPELVEGLDGIQAGQNIWVLTWLHESRRSTLKVYPRGELDSRSIGDPFSRPAQSGRSSPQQVLGVEGGQFIRVEGIEAIDGAP